MTGHCEARVTVSGRLTLYGSCSRPDSDLTTEVRLGARRRAHKGSEANADRRTSSLKARVKQTVDSTLIRFGLHRTERSEYV